MLKHIGVDGLNKISAMVPISDLSGRTVPLKYEHRILLVVINAQLYPLLAPPPHNLIV
jgi:hypothetical protein